MCWFESPTETPFAADWRPPGAGNTVVPPALAVVRASGHQPAKATDRDRVSIQRTPLPFGGEGRVRGKMIEARPSPKPLPEREGGSFRRFNAVRVGFPRSRPGRTEGIGRFRCLPAIHAELKCHRQVNDPTGTRTRVAGLKSRCPNH